MCSLAASLVHLPFKRVFRRPRPLGAGARSVGPLTSSFPSGHTASDLAFMFGAAQEPPLVLIPLSIGTLGSHCRPAAHRRIQSPAITATDLGFDSFTCAAPRLDAHDGATRHHRPWQDLRT
jgi:hypothetical protein